MFLPFSNNNQLRSIEVPFPIDEETFEMYASVLNSITLKNGFFNYCSLIKDYGSIG